MAATSLADIANNAAGKIGGFGDQLGGEGFISGAQLTANTSKVAQWVNKKYPIVRKQANAYFAAMKCPFKETRRFADLEDDLKQDDVAITTVASAGGVVTVTTDEVHGRTTGDEVFLADIKGTLVTSLNGTVPTITVTTTTAFTLDDVTGTASWSHTADTGIVSYVPEIGAWTYAFTLPSDYHAMVRQTDEEIITTNGVRTEYQHEPIPNIAGNGFLLLTNDLTNADADSAYIEYTFDQETFALFGPAFEECIATLLAAELCPIVGKDLETRQAILAEYKAITVPEAKRYNQSQFNHVAKVVGNYLGGRA